MNQTFQDDYLRMTGEKWTGRISQYARIMLHHNIQYVFLMRLYQRRKSIITRVLLYRLTRKYGLEISVKAHVGNGMYLGHAYNITVAEGVTLGRNVNLHKGCTIGRENRGRRSGVPIIGNRVYVGINATIVGNVRVGDDVLIAPGSFVNRDIPDHSIVIGNPCEVHSCEYATKGYINYCV